MNAPLQITLGIDVSKSWLDVALLRPDQPPLWKKFPNKLNGFMELSLWLDSLAPGLKAIGAAMEATGAYHQALAQFCFASGWKVHVINPARVKAYGVAVGQKNKTDRADALTIARFAASAPGLVPWVAPGATRAELRALVRERLHAQDALTSEQLRRATAPARALEFIDQRLALLQEEVKALWKRICAVIKEDAKLARLHALLVTIPGVGAWTAAFLLSELPPIDAKTKARQIASLFGLCPRNRESGSSVRAPARIAPQGRRRVSHQLYMPALVAMKYNEAIEPWLKGLQERGQTGKQLVCSAMHRLLRLVVGVLKTQQPFQPDWKGARP